ncbi:MAG: hypothetical protein GAK29_04872 [Acinetobacter bereziniae]|uniref:Phage tail fiber protein n=1 Tax=Acinetobacter bereziniae TaxID=106648 RepID=A0A833PAB4_ACIBZ|nr:MAG: hypothetical protein GAK29_04872 [Acinetobacter bereziniae]
MTGAKTNLQINRFVQDPSVTSMYAPTTGSRIIITDNSWGVWSVNPNFNSALSVWSGGTGNTQGIAPSANKLQNPRRINNVFFDGTGDINISAPMRYLGNANNSTLNGSLEDGFYLVADSSINGLYGYGVLEVRRAGSTVNQTYFSHMKNANGSVAVRQSWDNGQNFSVWRSLDPQGSVTLSGAVSGSGSFDNYGNVNISASVTQGLGVNQRWQDVTGSRAKATTYTNTSGRPKFINIVVDGNDGYGDAELFINGIKVGIFHCGYGTRGSVTISAIVPAEATYRLNSGSYISIWAELI